MTGLGQVVLAGLVALPLSATTHHVIVAGLGGEPEYQQRFQSLTQEMDKVLRSAPSTAVVALHGAEATKARLQATLQQVGRAATAKDELVLTLIGHGTFDGEMYRFNVPGPDVTANELATWLNQVPAGRQVVVNTTSASGGSVAALRKANRTVIVATRTGTEKNATLFARYWAEALRDASADADKNEAVSALEAYRYADQKVQQFYEAQKRLATEHALLNDTGAGDAVRAPSPQNGQGRLASAMTLMRYGAGTNTVARTPDKQRLFARREEIERRIDQLKYQKAGMPAEDYQRQLRQALVELARVQAEIDK